MIHLPEALRDLLARLADGRGRSPADRLGRELARHYERGDHDAAEAAALKLTVLQKETRGERHPDYAAALGNLALLVQRRGDGPAAEMLLREALKVRREALGEAHPETATTLVHLAVLLHERHDPAAGPMVRQALEIRRAQLGDDDPETLACADLLAHLDANLARHGSAPGRTDDLAPLRAEHEALVALFARVGARLLGTADRMRDAGAPPERAALEEAAACLDRFERLRGALIRHAQALGLPAPGHGLTDLGVMLDALAARREAHLDDRRASS